MLIFLPIRYKRSMCPIRCIFLQYNTAFTTATCTAEFHNCVKLVGFKGQRSGRHCDWPWLVTWFNEICARGRALINLKKTKDAGTTQKCVFRLLNLGFKRHFHLIQAKYYIKIIRIYSLLSIVNSFNDRNGRILLKYQSNQSCYGRNVCKKISSQSPLGCLSKPNLLVRILATVWLLTMIFTFRIFMIIFSSFNDVIFFNFVVWSVFTANRLDQRTNTILTNEMILNDPQLKFRAQ